MSGTNQVADIPDSASTVSVSIIDTSVRFKNWQIDPFVEPPKIAGHTHLTAPSWAFKIVHPKHGTYLFDLGVRKDWEDKLPPKSRQILENNGWTFTLDKDVAQILTTNGENLNDVKGIIWSHWHWDHVGDPSTFPTTTKIVVGPGFKSDILPGWPDDPEGRATSDAWKNREIEEVEMSDNLKVGGYRALDYFDDGSFYLLDSPGHTIGHLCALARTTADQGSSFILMGGDVAHHIGQVRPTSYIPLPDKISPDPQLSLDQTQSFCPCAGYVAIHPHSAKDQPYYKGSKAMATDADKAEESTQKLESLDGDPRVFTVIAHDDKLEGIIDVYPKEANQWREQGWKELSHWRFLGDFEPKKD